MVGVGVVEKVAMWREGKRRKKKKRKKIVEKKKTIADD